MSKVERKFTENRMLKDLLKSYIETELEIYLLENDDRVKKEANYGYN